MYKMTEPTSSPQMCLIGCRTQAEKKLSALKKTVIGSLLQHNYTVPPAVIESLNILAHAFQLPADGDSGLLICSFDVFQRAVMTSFYGRLVIEIHETTGTRHEC